MSFKIKKTQKIGCFKKLTKRMRNKFNSMKVWPKTDGMSMNKKQY